MIKRTLYFGNPAYLSKKNEQLVVGIPHAQGLDKMIGNTIPIEDIGIVILDHQQITITQALIGTLLENNVALITCDSAHLPTGLMLNLCGHTLQSQKTRAQLEASQPLIKQLWQQTIKAKIANQAAVLARQQKPCENMKRWVGEVKSGDTDNLEARAAAYYWKNIFTPLPHFTRVREGAPPNNMLNYGYAILRGIVARSLVGSGLLPIVGIHHRNQYNAYCLADDIMEPYRPYVDMLVLDIMGEEAIYTEINTAIKTKLLGIATVDVLIDGERSPLMIGVQKTTASLAKCYEGAVRQIAYPEI